MTRKTTQREMTCSYSSWLLIASLWFVLMTLAVALPVRSASAAHLTDAQREAIVRNFFQAYEAAIKDDDKVDAFLDLLIPDSPFFNIELTYAGAPGRFIPFAGTFIGQRGVRSALEFIRDTSDTDRFVVEEILTTSFAVDFSRGVGPGCPSSLTDCHFLIPQQNRTSAIIEDARTVRRTRLHYRLDMVCHLTIEEDGKISAIHFFYDSYVPSEAFVGDRDQIVNPDIDPVLSPRRDPAATPETTLAAVLGFLFTFADPAVNVFGNFAPLRNVITDDVVISFAGDPQFLPFADTKIREGQDAVLMTFAQQLANSRPRVFDIREFFVGRDRVVTNTFEGRTSTATNRGYDVFVQILMTAKEGKVGSIQGNFDSVITTTAFTGKDPFRCGRRPIDRPAC